jgi:ABC-2 type transport system permease protein
MTSPTDAERQLAHHTHDPIAVGSAARASTRARILDRGYRRYDGPRGGRGAATRSLATQTLQRVLGIRRSFWMKILPLISVFIAYVPAIVFVGITALLKDNPEADEFIRSRLLPTYGAYFGFVLSAILVFVGFVAPEVLCTDRRNGMLGLYLASPLTRETYLLAKALAVLSAVALVTVGPPVVYLVGLTLNEHGPDGFGAFLTVLGQVLLAGLAVALLPVSLSLAISSTTTRRAAASISIIMILSGSSAIVAVLVYAARLDSNLLVFDLLFLPFEVVFRIFTDGQHLSPEWADVSSTTVVAAYLAWTAACGLFVWSRYRRIEVSR